MDDQAMKKMMFFWVLILSLMSVSGQRRIDMTTRVLKPKAKDTFISPGLYYGEYAIINRGPDTVRYTDGFVLKIVFGNVIYPYITGKFGRDLPAGDSIVVKNNLPTRFDATNYRTEMCAELTKMTWANKSDTIRKESTAAQANNRTCVPMVHISYLGLEERSENGALYPNPCTDAFHYSAIPGDRLFLYNVQGCLIAPLHQTDGLVKIPRIPAGVYIVIVEKGNKSAREIYRIQTL